MKVENTKASRRYKQQRKAPPNRISNTKPNLHNVLKRIKSKILINGHKIERINNTTELVVGNVLSLLKEKLICYGYSEISKTKMSDYKTPGKARFEMNIGIASTPNADEKNKGTGDNISPVGNIQGDLVRENIPEEQNDPQGDGAESLAGAEA